MGGYTTGRGKYVAAVGFADSDSFLDGLFEGLVICVQYLVDGVQVPLEEESPAIL